MRWFGYGAFGLLCYLASLLAQLPAASLQPALAVRLPGLTAASLGGTPFDGVAHGLHWAGRGIERLRWRWQPQQLLRGRLAFRLRVDETASATEMQTLARLGWGGRVELLELRGRLSLPRALELAGVAPPPLNARLRLQLPRVEMQGRQPRAASGRVLIDGLHTAFGRTLQLGDFVLDLHTEDDSIAGVLRDRDGPLGVDGALVLNADGSYRFDARLRPQPQADPQVRQALQLLGRPNADGEWKLHIQGRLTL